MPFSFFRSLSLAWIFVVLAQPMYPRAGMFLFAFLCSSLNGLVKAIGLRSLSSAANGAAIILWAVITLPVSKNKCTMLLAVAWSLLVNVALVVALHNFQALQDAVPEAMRGFTMPCIVTAYDCIGSITLGWFFRYAVSDSDTQALKLITYVSAWVIMTAETLRLLGILSLSKKEAWSTDLVINIASNLVFDLLARTSFLQSVACWLLGWSTENSPERELQLRARFSMSYIPFFTVAVQLPFAIQVGGLSLSGRFGYLVMAAFVSELVSDVSCLLFLRQGGESMLATFHRLQIPGQHQGVFSRVHPEEGEEERVPTTHPQEAVQSQGAHASSEGLELSFDFQTMGWWFILSYSVIMVDLSFNALQGSCGWQLSRELCE